jgi:transposase
VPNKRGIARHLGAGVESSDCLERHRWVVERPMSWLSHVRRLANHHAQKANIYHVFLHPACSLIRLRRLEGRF